AVDGRDHEVVVHHEHVHAHYGRTPSFVAICCGNRATKVAPPSESSSRTVTPPPRRCVSTCTRASPTPRPAVPAGLVLHPRRKIVSTCSGATPGPLSATSTTTS